MRVNILILGLVIPMLIFCAENLVAGEAIEGAQRAGSEVVRVQTLVACNPDGLVSLTVSDVTSDGTTGSKFDIARRGESYKLFIDKEDIWTWNSRTGYRLYRYGKDRTLIVIDPKAKGMKIPDQVIMSPGSVKAPG